MERVLLFIVRKLAILMGMTVTRRLWNNANHPERVQRSLLVGIMRKNRNTEYGKKHGFKNIRSVDEFQRRVPVVRYADIEPDIRAMYESGRRNILSAQFINEYITTSGTTGNVKVLPYSADQLKADAPYGFMYMWGHFSKFLGKNALCGKSINLVETILPGMIGSEASLSSYMEPYMIKHRSLLSLISTSPIEAVIHAPGVDCTYVHARFALMAGDEVCEIMSWFSSIIHQFFVYIERNHDLLANDIERGVIHESIVLPDDLRKAILHRIKPMPERAQEIREVFRTGFPIAKKLWKNMSLASGIGTGDFSLYTTKLRERYLGDEIPFNNVAYVASEGLFAVPFRLNDPNFVFSMNTVFYEFLPLGETDYRHLVTLDRVEIGKDYEIVITNHSGLYRYRMEEAVKITGKLNNCPTMEFLYRINRNINLFGEKTNEIALQTAAAELARDAGIVIHDFCVYANRDLSPPRYEIFLETGQRVDPMDKSFAQMAQNALGHANEVYREVTEEILNIAMPAVYFVKEGTFSHFRSYMLVDKGSTVKTKPKRIITDEYIGYFRDAVLQN